jgi:hypothetical protein
MKRVHVGLALIVLALAAAFAFWLRHELRVDDCLDLGGRWNSETSVCEGASSK